MILIRFSPIQRSRPRRHSGKNRATAIGDAGGWTLSLRRPIFLRMVPYSHFCMTMDDTMPTSTTTLALDTESFFSRSDWKRFQDAEKSFVPFLLVDDEGTIQGVSPAARRLLDYGPEEQMDRCFFAHVHGRNQRRVMQDLAQVMRRHKRTVSWLLRLLTGTGRWRWFRAVAHAAPDDPSLVAVRLRRV